MGLVLLVLGAGTAAYLFSRPTLEFTNRLLAPVRLTVGSQRQVLVPAGQAMRMALPRGKALVVTWELVRPLSADGRPMGEEVRESQVEADVRGTVRRLARPRGLAGDYFAPLITNATDDLLRVKVNAGLEGAVDCGCAVRPGARRVFIGYYRLYQNSTVEASVTGEGRAMFRDLGPNVVAPTGALGLRFESRDFSHKPSGR